MAQYFYIKKLIKIYIILLYPDDMLISSTNIKGKTEQKIIIGIRAEGFGCCRKDTKMGMIGPGQGPHRQPPKTPSQQGTKF